MRPSISTKLLTEIVVIAALLHDIGKSNLAFQERLKKLLGGGDFYRHEWLSLKLFVLIVDNSTEDSQWLTRLADVERISDTLNSDLLIRGIKQQVSSGHFERAQIDNLPPLAQWVAWLIVTHHRLPLSAQTDTNDIKKCKEKLGRLFKARNTNNDAGVTSLYGALESFDDWQKNPIVAKKDKLRAEKSWQFKELVTSSNSWRKAIAHYAAKALSNPLLFNQDGSPAFTKPIDDSYLLYLSRLMLILSDHNYSSLSLSDPRRVSADTKKVFTTMFANSNKFDGSLRQSLDEHLIGVGVFADDLARNLPATLQNLPHLHSLSTLNTNTSIGRFKWQNRAYAKVASVRLETERCGFFGVNLASTGCGKTVGNARIMAALADPDIGARFTVALGLQVLTLQTGQQFRKLLSLSDKEVAVVIGGDVSRELYDMRQKGVESTSEVDVLGSESSAPLYKQYVDSGEITSVYKGLDTVLSEGKPQKMLLSPILTCTIDHLMQSTESLNGGHHILPALRLMSSDLVLDEPDDFGVNDLYGLARLVFLTGQLGSRVLLSSATLTPSMVRFLFDAYYSGRSLYNKANGLPMDDALKVPCLFLDEQECEPVIVNCGSHTQIDTYYNGFTEARGLYLSQLAIRRSAEILPLNLSYNKDFPEDMFNELTQVVVNEAARLHSRHHDYDAKLKRRVSVGLVRMAYTKSIVAIAQSLASRVTIPNETHIHFCCYHSRQILALRSSLESKLDVILNRSDAGKTLFDNEYVSQAINEHNATNHIFIVLATSIAEVGRDHDYDWAIVEPTSVRSLIQLAGRVWRHRPDKVALTPNISVMQYNLRYYTRTANRYGNQGVFIHSGFESEKNKPATYDATKLLDTLILGRIDSQSRLLETDYALPAHSLAQLEHNRLRQTFDVSQCCLANAIWHKSSLMYALCGDIQTLTPFRESTEVEIEYVCQVTQDGFNFYLQKELSDKNFSRAALMNHKINECGFISSNNDVSLWLESDSTDIYDELAAYKDTLDEQQLTMAYFTARLKDEVFIYNEFLGFYQA